MRTWKSNHRLRLMSAVLALVLGALSLLAIADLAVEPYEHRPIVQNQLLEERLTGLLPRLMRESQIDMWIVIAREYNDDPVFMSLAPKPRFTARRTTMLVFFDQAEGGLERLTVSRYPLGALYEAAWEGGDLDAQWQRLATIVEERNPEKIAVNVSDTWPVERGAAPISVAATWRCRWRGDGVELQSESLRSDLQRAQTERVTSHRLTSAAGVASRRGREATDDSKCSKTGVWAVASHGRGVTSGSTQVRGRELERIKEIVTDAPLSQFAQDGADPRLRKRAAYRRPRR